MPCLSRLNALGPETKDAGHILGRIREDSTEGGVAENLQPLIQPKPGPRAEAIWQITMGAIWRMKSRFFPHSFILAQDSNPRPMAWESSILAIGLVAHSICFENDIYN